MDEVLTITGIQAKLNSEWVLVEDPLTLKTAVRGALGAKAERFVTACRRARLSSISMLRSRDRQGAAS